MAVPLYMIFTLHIHTMFSRLALTIIAALGLASSAQAVTVEKLKYSDFNSWVIRNIKESAVLGGNTKTLYEIGPSQTIEGAKAYKNLGGSPWATSNVYAKVMGVVKCSNAVYRDSRGGNDYCVKMTTILEHVKALGIINMDVLVSGSIFLGEIFEPISSTKKPYSKMEMGIPFTKRPNYLIFDYKLTVPANGHVIYSSGFGSKKTLAGKDHAEVYILLQRRWEDAKGNIHAMRVGTGRQRFSTSTNGWVNNHKIPVWYGDITKHAGYQSYMGLISKENSYYARNSKGKMVPVVEEGWDSSNATPTHMLIMASSGCGVAYTGMVGMTFWVDNIELGY